MASLLRFGFILLQSEFLFLTVLNSLQIHSSSAWPSYGNISHGDGWEEIKKVHVAAHRALQLSPPQTDSQQMEGSSAFIWIHLLFLSHVGRYFRYTRLLSVFTPFLSLSVCRSNPTLRSKSSLIGLNRSFGPRAPTPPQNVPVLCRSNDWEDAEREDAGRGWLQLGQ